MLPNVFSRRCIFRLWHFLRCLESSKETTLFYIRDLLQILLSNIKRIWANYLISIPAEIIIKQVWIWMILRGKVCKQSQKIKKQNFLAPFFWMGFICLKATKSLQGDSLLFTNKFQGVPDAHLIDLRKMTGWVDLWVIMWSWTINLETGTLTNRALLHKTFIKLPKFKSVKIENKISFRFKHY